MPSDKNLAGSEKSAFPVNTFPEDTAPDDPVRLRRDRADLEEHHIFIDSVSPHI